MDFESRQRLSGDGNITAVARWQAVMACLAGGWGCHGGAFALAAVAALAAALLRLVREGVSRK